MEPVAHPVDSHCVFVLAGFPVSSDLISSSAGTAYGLDILGCTRNCGCLQLTRLSSHLIFMLAGNGIYEHFNDYSRRE